VDLEDRLQKQTLLDISSDGGARKEYARNWFDLSILKICDRNDKQWHLALRVREKLKEYSTSSLPFTSIYFGLFRRVSSSDNESR
jgi:hypothetical protein